MRFTIDLGMAASFGLWLASGFNAAHATPMAREVRSVPAPATIRCAGRDCASLAWPYPVRRSVTEASENVVSPRRVRVIPIHAAPLVR